MSYIFWGITVAAALILLSRRIGYGIKIAVLIATLLILGIAAALNPGIMFLGGAHWYDQSPYKEGILFALMLLGMAARTLSLAIEQSRQAGSAHRTLNVDFWDFVYPFLVAFITFGAVMAQIGAMSLSLSSLIFAFQNGFFWQTLMKARQEASAA